MLLYGYAPKTGTHIHVCVYIVNMRTSYENQFTVHDEKKKENTGYLTVLDDIFLRILQNNYLCMVRSYAILHNK